MKVQINMSANSLTMDQLEEYKLPEPYYRSVKSTWVNKSDPMRRGHIAAKVDNEVVGLLLYTGLGNSWRGVMLTLVYVQPKYRGKGVGNGLVNFMKELQQEGINDEGTMPVNGFPNRFILSCCNNDISVRLHRRNGFVPAQHSKLPEDVRRNMLEGIVLTMKKTGEVLTAMVYND